MPIFISEIAEKGKISVAVIKQTAWKESDCTHLLSTHDFMSRVSLL